MSVINTMLKKLDARGADAAAGGLDLAAALAQAAPAAHQPRPSRLPLLLLVGGLAIGVTAFADWPILVGAAPAPATAPAPTPLAVAAEPAPPVAAPAPEVTRPTAPPPAQRVAALAPAKPRALPAPAAEPAEPVASPTVPAVALPAPVAMPARIDKRPTPMSAEQRQLALYRQATELAQAGQRRGALERAHEALTLDPRHAPTRLLAAVLEHETGAQARAAQLLRDGLAMHPRDAAMALLLARLLVADGAGGEALAVLDQHGVTGADADGLRGGILAQQGDFKRSLAAYESAARQQPSNPMWWFGLGVALDSEGQAPRARQAYARAQSIGLPREDLATYADQRIRSLD